MLLGSDSRDQYHEMERLPDIVLKFIADNTRGHDFNLGLFGKS